MLFETAPERFFFLYFSWFVNAFETALGLFVVFYFSVFYGCLQLEGKLRKALSEVEARERQLKAREESWKSDHAQKLSELQLLQRRLREETKHQVW